MSIVFSKRIGGAAVPKVRLDGIDPYPTWESFLPTPNFPENLCGNCAYAGSVAEVMAEEDGPLPTGGVRVSSMSSPKAVVQILPSWAEWAQQGWDSRIYGARISALPIKWVTRSVVVLARRTIVAPRGSWYSNPYLLMDFWKIFAQHRVTSLSEVPNH